MHHRFSATTTTTTRPGRARLALTGLFALSLPLILAGCSEGSTTAEEDRPTVTQTVTKPASSSSATSKSKEPTRERATKRREPKPVKGKCPYPVIGENSTERPEFGSVSSSFCDGQWLRAGEYGTDHVWLERFDGQEWVKVDPDGTAWSGMTGPCFSEPRLRSMGAPPEILDEARMC